jgi:hypothetical protein
MTVAGQSDDSVKGELRVSELGPSLVKHIVHITQRLSESMAMKIRSSSERCECLPKD